jgi:hypothetical protein
MRSLAELRGDLETASSGDLARWVESHALRLTKRCTASAHRARTTRALERRRICPSFHSGLSGSCPPAKRVPDGVGIRFESGQGFQLLVPFPAVEPRGRALALAVVHKDGLPGSRRGAATIFKTRRRSPPLGT